MSSLQLKMSFFKSLKLFLLNVWTTFFRLMEWSLVVVRYYFRKPQFFLIDASLASQYLLKSPHRISRDFLRERGEKNLYAYGETPLTTLDKIARECQILSKDTLYELGCGTGRGSFWLAQFVRCRVVGIDYLPNFITKAERALGWAQLPHLQFQNTDMLKVDFRKATALYLYGTCLEESTILQLIDRFQTLKPGTKVISVSYPITEYSSTFVLKKQFSARFPWGKADIFLNIKL